MRVHGKRLATSTILKLFYTEFPGARWATRHLAVELGVDPRTVRKAVAKLPGFGFRLVEVSEESCVMPGDLPRRRFLEPLPHEDPPGRPPLSVDLLGTTDPGTDQGEQRETSHVDPESDKGSSTGRQIGEISTPAGGSTRPRRRTHERARGARASRVRADRSRERPQTPAPRPPRSLRRSAPVACEAGVWRALRQRYDGAWVSGLGRELCFERYHQRPVEAERALRTCLVRFPEGPGALGLLRMFRGFFTLACRGEGLCDEPTWRAKDRAMSVASLLDAGPGDGGSAELWEEFVAGLEGRLGRVQAAGGGGSEQAELLAEALVPARAALARARVREGVFQRDSRIAREVARDTRFVTSEERFEEADARVTQADREAQAEALQAAHLAALSDEDLERYAKQGLADTQQAVRAGSSWRVVENLAKTALKYQRERERRSRSARGEPA